MRSVPANGAATLLLPAGIGVTVTLLLPAGNGVTVTLGMGVAFPPPGDVAGLDAGFEAAAPGVAVPAAGEPHAATATTTATSGPAIRSAVPFTWW